MQEGYAQNHISLNCHCIGFNSLRFAFCFELIFTSYFKYGYMIFFFFRLLNHHDLLSSYARQMHKATYP